MATQIWDVAVAHRPCCTATLMHCPQINTLTLNASTTAAGEDAAAIPSALVVSSYRPAGALASSRLGRGDYNP